MRQRNALIGDAAINAARAHRGHHIAGADKGGFGIGGGGNLHRAAGASRQLGGQRADQFELRRIDIHQADLGEPGPGGAAQRRVDE